MTPVSQKIEELAQLLCEDTEGPGTFQGEARNTYLIKALLLYVDQRDQDLNAWTKAVNGALRHAFKGARHRTIIPSPRAVHPCAADDTRCDEVTDRTALYVIGGGA